MNLWKHLTKMNWNLKQHECCGDSKSGRPVGESRLLRHLVANDFVALKKPSFEIFETKAALLTLADVKNLVFDVPQTRKVAVEHDLASAAANDPETLHLVELAAADATSGNGNFLVLLVDEKLLEHNPSADLNFDVVRRKLLADLLLEVVNQSVDDFELLDRDFEEGGRASYRVRERRVEAVNDSAKLLRQFEVRLGDGSDADVKNVLKIP